MVTPQEIGLRIETRRKELSLTLSEIANSIGVAESTVQRYEKGRIENIKLPVIEAIANVLNVNPAWIVCKTDDPTPIKASIKIPVLGSIPAGIPMEAIEDIIDWEEIPESMCNGEKEYFGLRVKGDSMYPEYLDGDTVIVRKTPCCDSGDVCVVYVNGYDATLKRIKLNEDGSITLQPRNPEYPPRTYSLAEVESVPVSIAGVVVELRRKVKK
ncbi:MAG: helix-turn-helix domain-containing protein [Oscillospiraceae bacterium]|jgi:repressor LexA|nr:helix-turn-helix domain-containing protein [Oscillospiraceae bacterium]